MTNGVFTLLVEGPTTINIVVGSDASRTSSVTDSPAVPVTDSNWDMAIVFVSPVVVWVIARYFPRLPKKYLPMLTPAIGILVGMMVNLATNAHLGWWTMAKAGMMAVFIREVTNQTITKSLQNRPSDSDDASPSTRPLI